MRISDHQTVYRLVEHGVGDRGVLKWDICRGGPVVEDGAQHVRRLAYVSLPADPVSNGNPHGQAVIRRWWHECHGERGQLVFEYHFDGRFADGVLFPNARLDAGEENGRNAEVRFPVSDAEIVRSEAKMRLTPEVIGQALVYRYFAESAGARILETTSFCQSASTAMMRAAVSCGLRVEVALI